MTTCSIVLKVIGLIPAKEAASLIKEYRDKSINHTAFGYGCHITDWTFICTDRYEDYFYYYGYIYSSRHSDGYVVRLDAVW